MAETSTQEKAKKQCYERRAACIMKKSKELEILCGVKIAVVILNPDGKLESWPPELSDVKALLDACKERPGVKRQKKKDPENSHCCREILVSKLQGEEFFKSAKGKEIATTSTSQGATPVLRSKKRKDFHEGYLEILNSKLELLNKREMEFSNLPGNSASAEGKEIAAVGQDGDDLGGEFVSMDEFFNFEQDKSNTNNLLADPQNNNGNAATFKGKEIATMENMDSGILQGTAYLGAYQCDENGELTCMNNGMSNKGLEPNQWHHGSSSDWFDAPLQNSFTALGNCLPSTAAEEYCGEVQVRKKARQQNSTAALNNNLPLVTPADYWETLLTNSGLVNSTDAMLSLLYDF